MVELEPLLSPEEIARLTGLHYQTVLDVIRRGDLPASKLGNRWRIRPGDYSDWLDATRLEPRDPEPRPGPIVRPLHARRTGAPGSLERLAEIENQRR